MTARPVTARAATNYGPLAQRTMDRWQSEIGPPNRPPPARARRRAASARHTTRCNSLSCLFSKLRAYSDARGKERCTNYFIRLWHSLNSAMTEVRSESQ